tara:strand:+ start:4585 stop:4851 length:267 start_codon:yes stop_codon:yes gene_type:complete
LKGIKIYKQNCDPKDAEDRTLPYTSYLVEYKMDGKTCYDLAITGKKVDLFDYYWDLYRNDFVGFTQTEGRINPKLWNDPNEPKKGKKK